MGQRTPPFFRPRGPLEQYDFTHAAGNVRNDITYGRHNICSGTIFTIMKVRGAVEGRGEGRQGHLLEQKTGPGMGQQLPGGPGRGQEVPFILRGGSSVVQLSGLQKGRELSGGLSLNSRGK